jgi:Protein of unknown function (DUF4238)
MASLDSGRGADVGEKAIRHHTVPQFYLNGFAQARQIVTVDLESGRTFRQAVAQAASENHFYSIPENPGGSDAFEKILSQVEDKTARVFQRVLQKKEWPLDADSRGALAAFMTLQFLRGPDHRQQMEQITARVAELLIRATGPEGLVRQAAERGDALSDDDAKEMWRVLGSEGGVRAEVPASNHIRQMIDLLPKLVVYFLGRPWVLVRFTRRSLITSDAPLSPIPETTATPGDDIGLMTAWGMTFPLDRHTGIILASPMPLADRGATLSDVAQGKFDHIQEPTTRLERFFNTAATTGANRWIFHHPDDGRFLPSGLHAEGEKRGRADITAETLEAAVNTAEVGEDASR